MNNKDVFISYKAEEFEEANWVKNYLEAEGITCWLAPLSIRGGASYAAEIPQAIRNCKVFVLVLSEKCQQSKWVPRELDQAINEEKVVMPFMIEKCDLNDEFGFYLSNVQRYEAHKDKTDAAKRMSAEIFNILGIVKEEIKLQKTVTVKKQQKQKNKKKCSKGLFIGGMIGAAILTIAILVIGAISLVKMSRITIAGETFKKSVSSVSLSNTTVTDDDLKAIASLKKLSSVYIDGCTIKSKNLGQICDENIWKLSLSDCNLTDEQVASINFKKMTDLYSINLSGNTSITNLEGLADVADSLREIIISDTGIRSLDCLSGLNNLNYVYADNNGITSLEPLKDCAELTILSVNGNELSDLKGLEQCIELDSLYAVNNKLTSLNGLENATILSKVYLNGNSITNATILEKSEATLKKVYLNDNKLTDIEFLSGCEKLYCFSADNNNLFSIRALEKCTELTEISVEHNNLISLQGLENCKKLNFVDVSDNDIQFINSLSNLEWNDEFGTVLDLSNNRITKLSLPSNADYRLLNLHGNSIVDLSILQNSKIDCLVVDYREGIDFELIAQFEIGKYQVVNCPLDKQVAVKQTLGENSTTFCTEEELDEVVPIYVIQD